MVAQGLFLQPRDFAKSRNSVHPDWTSSAWRLSFSLNLIILRKWSSAPIVWVPWYQLNTPKKQNRISWEGMIFWRSLILCGPTFLLLSDELFDLFPKWGRCQFSQLTCWVGDVGTGSYYLILHIPWHIKLLPKVSKLSESLIENMHFFGKLFP